MSTEVEEGGMGHPDPGPRGCRAIATQALSVSAKANNLEPPAYIHHVLAHIGAADTVEKLEALLPWNTGLEAASQKI